MKKIIFFLHLICWAWPTAAFFFNLNRSPPMMTEPSPPATESVPLKLFANKPIHIHHHYKWKYVTPPPTTTTEGPWAWAPPPPSEPTWSLKPVFEEPQEEVMPQVKWQKPYKFWGWPPTTTTAEPETTELILTKWKQPPELLKWQPPVINNWQPPEPEQWQTPPATNWQKSSRIPQKWNVKRNTDNESQKLSSISNIAKQEIPIIKSKTNINASENTTDVINDSEEIESGNRPPLNHKKPNILYKYMYHVNSPSTKDIKLHQEQSDELGVTGHYSFVEPDGSTRVVYYTAGDDGFQANVKHLNRPFHKEDTTKDNAVNSDFIKYSDIHNTAARQNKNLKTIVPLIVKRDKV